jgi:hypothetical protein
MSRVGIPLLVGILSAVFLPLAATAAEPELWSCTKADGSTTFTNKTKDLRGCGAYVLRSELGYVSRAAEEKKEEPKLTEAQPQSVSPPININIMVNAPPPPALPVIETVPVGEIPYEVVRMLSVGMTEAEILRRAGLPQATLTGSHSFSSPFPFWPIFGANRFVYSSGDWIIELTFTGGRVFSINEVRVRP